MADDGDVSNAHAVPTAYPWVLGTFRQGALDPARRSAAGFARFAGVHRAQVGRWERGEVQLTQHRAMAYDAVVGAVPGSAMAALELLWRDVHAVGTTALVLPDDPLDPAGSAVAAGDQLELVLAPHPLTAMDWWTLADLLAGVPAVVLRDRDWEELLHRLVSELEFAFGSAYSLRFAAFARLLDHPRAGLVMTRMADEGLRDNARHLFSDLASGLQFVDRPEAVAMLVGQVLEPAHEGALWASLFTLATCVRLRGLPAEAREMVAAACAAYVIAEDQSFRVRRSAAVLVRTLQPARAAGLAARTSMTARAHGVAEVLRFGYVLAEGQRRALMDRCVERLRADGYLVDAAMRAVLTRSIGEADVDLRGNALALLMLTPQGRTIARAVTEVLVEESRGGSPAPAYECVTMLFWLATADSVESMLSAADDTRVPDDLRRSLRYAATTGLAPGRRDLVALFRSSADRVYADAPDDRAAAAAVTYAFGARGHQAELQRLRLRARRDGAGVWVTACDSWLTMPAWLLPADAQPA